MLAAPYGPAPSWPAKYPLLHRDLLRVVDSVAEPVARAAGVTGAEDLDRALFLAGRTFTLLLALVTLRLAFVAARGLGGRAAAWIASLVWLAVLPQVYYAKTANLDAPYVFWFALALVAFVRLRREPSLRSGLAFGACAAAAVLTKDQAYALFVLPFALLAFETWKRRRESSAPAVALAAAIAVAVALAAASYRLWTGVGMLGEHVDAVLAHPSTYGFTSPDLSGRWDALFLALRHVGWSFGLPLALVVAELTAVALWRAFRRQESSPGGALLLFPASYALFGLAPLGYQYDRFFLPVCLVLALVSGIELARRLERATEPASRVVMALLVVAAAGWGIARAVAIDRAMLGDRRYALEAETRDRPRAAAFVHAVRAPHGFRPLLDPVRRAHSAVPIRKVSPYLTVAIPTADLGDFGLAQLAGDLRGGACGFREERPELAAPSPLSRFPGFEGVLSNLGEIDPPLLLFSRPGPAGPCD